MKKLNKLFLAAGSIAAVAAPVAAVVSCGGATTQIKNGNGVSYITDGGLITDHSFNEESWGGAGDFVKLAQSAKPGYASQLIQPGSTSTTGYATAYNSIKGKDVVLSGFMHDNPKGNNGDVRTWYKSHSDKNIVAIDIEDKNANDKFYGVTFKTEQSGFVAAAEAGYMLNAKFKSATDTSTIKVATFGGINIPTVRSYMNGFAAGVEWFNANSGAARKLEIIHNGGDASHDFSGSFAAGGAIALVDNLLKAGAQAILPVAGVQSADAAAEINKNNHGSAFLIGVDVDQSKVFHDTVLVSAIKGIRAATVDMLERINGLNGKSNPQDKEYTIADGEGFVGAIPNATYASLLDAADKAKVIAAVPTTFPEASAMYKG